MFLEDLLGLTAGGMDIPDAVGWELKWHTDRTGLVTLFHKEPDGPDAIMRYMVRKYGWKDKQGRLSFRHTIKGRSERFKVDDSGGQLVVRRLKGNGPVPYWSHEELIAAAGAKLRRLLLVKGERRGNPCGSFKQTLSRRSIWRTLYMKSCAARLPWTLIAERPSLGALGYGIMGPSLGFHLT